MITAHKNNLLERCRERGYTLDEVRACIVSEDGDQITVDVDHPAYPRQAKPGFVPPKQPQAATPRIEAPPPAPTSGPGTELKSLLKGWFGIQASPNCSCNARAMEMDRRGVEWCESPEGMATILGWLREEAGKRGLPFVELGAKILVKRAISAAKRKQRDNK